MSSVRNALSAARSLGVERLDAQLLLAQVLGRNRAWLIANDGWPVADDARERFDQLVTRRARGEPCAYLLGAKEFHGLDLRIDARVLVPRPDTEVLVDWAVALLREDFSGIEHPSVVDLGTGSGAIAISLALECPGAEVDAVDFSPAALEVAQNNAMALGARVRFHAGSWYAPLEGQHFNCIVSNPPYIAEADPHLAQGDLRFEPLSALASGRDGLADIDQIIAHADAYLEKDGWLLLEHGYDQAEAVRKLLEDAGFCGVQSWRDLAGIERVSGGHL